MSELTLPHGLDLQAALQVGITAAKAAGQLMLARVHGPKTINTKASRVDLVTDVDLACDELIRKTISAVYPEHGLLTEETFTEEALALTNGTVWIVDPIDGTTNFTHAYPASAVAIALMHHQQLLVSVTYDPYRDELFTAVKGQGAFLNGKAISVSSVKTVSESLIATGFAFRRESDAYEAKLQELLRVLRESHDIRRVGSAAIDMAYVACGRQEGFYESNLGPWDVAAGELLIEEAGGSVSKITGGDLNYQDKRQNVLATNAHIHQELSTFLDN